MKISDFSWLFDTTIKHPFFLITSVVLWTFFSFQLFIQTFDKYGGFIDKQRFVSILHGKL